jgi:HSP20 family protein
MVVFVHGLSETGGCDWTPSFDVYRTARGWVLKLDLAGVRPEDVSVEVEGPRVFVRGVRRDRIVESGWRHYSMEISYCRFQRSIQLPSSLEGARIASEYRDGMLIVRIDTKGTTK